MPHQARPYPGHISWWQPPADLTDTGEHPLATALRELAEETDIRPPHRRARQPSTTAARPTAGRR